MKTYSVKASEIKRDHHLIDAEDKMLGRVAVDVARFLMGKNKPTFTRNIDVGDFVTVINAAKVKVSGKKLEQKLYYRHSGYPGGFKSVSLEKVMETHPERAIEYAVKGMLPPNRMRARAMKKLTIYTGPVTPQKQKPVKVIDEVKTTEKEQKE